jgi:RecA-family ATPase
MLKENDLKFETFKELKEKVVYQSNDAELDRKYESWILEPLIPFKSITILDGLGGSGKSWFALDLSYVISLGGNFIGKYPVKQSGTVLYVTAEEIPEEFVRRIDLVTASYGDNENFYWMSTLHEAFPYGTALLQKVAWSITKTETARVLEYFIGEIKPVLVVLDSMVNFYGLNENDSSEASIFYEMLKGWIKTYNCSFLLLHHQNKESMKSKEDEGTFRGSVVFREQARERITYKSFRLENGMIVRKISIEKANYYSPLLKDFPVYLRWDTGTHVYDEELDSKMKQQEEEKKKTKNEKKSSKGENLKKQKEDKIEPLNLF